MVAKLHAYGLDMMALRLIYSYLSNKKQRVKLINIYIYIVIYINIYVKTLFRVLHGSKFCPYCLTFSSLIYFSLS